MQFTKDNFKILICCHKNCTLPKNDDGIFLPIHVGASLSKENLAMQRDDQVNQLACDNISAKNASFCELTAIYWAWKNIKTLYPKIEYIGLNHYRRYFCFDKNLAFEHLITKNIDEINEYTLDYTKIETYLSKYNAIVSKQKNYPYSLETDYSVCHFSDDIKKFKKVCHEMYPEYDNAIDHIITYGNKLSHFNMFIMRFEDFSAYCNCLFSILFKCEKITDISNYTQEQTRIWGYLAERFFNVWIYKNFEKTKKLPVYFFDLSFASAKRNFFSRAKFYLRKELCAFLLNPRKK